MPDELHASLSSSEWRIMERLWAESPRTLMQLYHALKGETGWSKSTVNTLLARMEAKRLIRYDEGGKAREYYPLLAREQAALSETQSLLGRVYRGSVGMMMSTLVENKALSREEIDELYAILQAAEEAHQHD